MPDLKLVSGSADSLPILAVYHIDEAIRVVEVVPPEGPELFLASHVPDCEQHVLVLHLLHVEACEHMKACRLSDTVCCTALAEAAATGSMHLWSALC